ncbi:MAG: SRPBCC family protein [Stagnimonas sp.]|nr:SRPBCC family protein [Stagnimonas sp.]
MRLLLMAGLLSACGPALAWQLQSLQVGHRGDDYRVAMQALIAAPPARVFAQLADLSALSRLNPSVRSVQLGVLDAEGRWPLTTTVEFCLLAVCRELRHSQRVRILPEGATGGRIESQTEPPPASDFQRGEARWQVSAEGSGSRLQFEASLQPGFWLPPLIGPWAVERWLRNEARLTVERLELLSLEAAP